MESRTFLPLVLFVLPTLLPGQKAGTLERTLEVDDREREYLIHVPRSYKGKKDVAVVLMLHGRSSSDRVAARHYGWVPLSDKAGFIAVFPNALGSPRSWKPAWGTRTTVDSTFLAKLIDKVVKEYRVDKDRIFMTGHSSGGIMSFSFAATHSDKVAAIGPVAGTIGWNARGRTQTIPKPKGPVSVITFHGMADSVVPYDRERGGNARYNMLVSAPESAVFFARHNGCAKEPKRTNIMNGRVHVDTWADGNAGTRVVFYSIEGGSHMWPNGRRNKVNSTESIWKFFRENERKPGEVAGQENEKKKDKKKKRKKTIVR